MHGPRHSSWEVYQKASASNVSGKHQLARELSRHGHSISDPASERRVARRTGKSRSTMKRYLASGVEVELTPDEHGNVQVRCTTQDIRCSIEAVRGEKRGPKN